MAGQGRGAASLDAVHTGGGVRHLAEKKPLGAMEATGDLITGAASACPLPALWSSFGSLSLGGCTIASVDGTRQYLFGSHFTRQL